MSPNGQSWRNQPAAVQDLLVAALLGAAWFGLATYWELRGWRPRAGDVWDLAGATSMLVLAMRSWAPAALLSVVVLAYALLYDVQLQSEFHLLPVLIVAYVAAQRDLIGAIAGALSSLAAGLALSTGWLHPSGLRIRGLDWSGILFNEFAVSGMVLLGVLTAAHRRNAVVLAARNEELERLRSVESERAVALERTRIARELHDDIAHHLTALIVRAQAAERVASSRPEVAVESMGWFAETARYALTAMRRTVSVLREGDGPAQLAPGPTLDDLDPIVTRVRSTGLDVALHVDEHLPAMEPQVQHAVVRVVQESLTNVLRHAGANQARVSVSSSAEEGIAVVVEDDGSGPDPDESPGGGLGIIGMRERAASCGGRLAVDRSTLGGWRVRGWFPAAIPVAGP
ncbi:MAG TPA: sensor histidine kinase [Acidimicrobiales bacterium]